jgi:hypothetical protein
MQNTTKTPKRLTRKQINEGLDTVPISALLTGTRKELTAKQARFARDVALGATKADAYRNNYNVTSKATMTSKPYALAADDRVKAEIEAIKRANEAEHIKNPAALRALVINTLVELATNPDTKDAVRLQAVKVLGGVTEVAAFTERKETRVITSSDDARAEIMAELRALSNADAIDVESEAAGLLDELRESAPDATHPTPTPTCAEDETPPYIHTIPHEPTPKNSNPDDPTPLPQDDPPSSFPQK